MYVVSPHITCAASCVSAPRRATSGKAWPGVARAADAPPPDAPPPDVPPPDAASVGFQSLRWCPRPRCQTTQPRLPRRSTGRSSPFVVSPRTTVVSVPVTDQPTTTAQALDEERLVGVLQDEDLRLLRVEWLHAQPDGYKLPQRQKLEELERADLGLSPLLTGAEAVALIRSGNREVGALSYGWLLPWDPDPIGARMALLRRALLERRHIQALFWDQATLYQPPRSQKEDEAFKRALHVMMDLYASAIGTTCVPRHCPSPAAPDHSD